MPMKKSILYNLDGRSGMSKIGLTEGVIDVQYARYDKKMPKRIDMG
jgi:hypothetical protein